MIRVSLAGATGWAGSALAEAIAAAEDMELSASVSRSHAGELMHGSQVYGTVREALAKEATEVFVEYTKPEFALDHVLQALGQGAHVVIGTSGLDNDDFARIDAVAREAGLGVLACGNFSITAVLLMKFSEMAARWIPEREIVEYTSAGKKDVPSGTVRELVALMAQHGDSPDAVPEDAILGPIEARGASIDGTRVHAIRLPGYVISVETQFGKPDERLTIRHDAGNGAEPYNDGALLAIREVSNLLGLHRGLSSVMKF